MAIRGLCRLTGRAQGSQRPPARARRGGWRRTWAVWAVALGGRLGEGALTPARALATTQWRATLRAVVAAQITAEQRAN
eukprot:4953735-Pleurochrysis_carterae.AAC.2